MKRENALQPVESEIHRFGVMVREIGRKHGWPAVGDPLFDRADEEIRAAVRETLLRVDSVIRAVVAEELAIVMFRCHGEVD